MEENSEGILKLVTEFIGRQTRFLPPVFPENEVVVGPYELQVNLLGAGYLHSFPAMAAIVVAANGERYPALSGYVHLPPGTYKIYYVDTRERYTTLPDIRAVSSDGATVTLVVGITYRVDYPAEIQNVRNPLDALFKGCEAAIRQVIRTHRHDELIGKPNDPNTLPNGQVAQDVQVQISLIEACHPFSLLNVNVIDRQGHSRLLNIREQVTVQQRASEREIESTIQQQKITVEEKDLVGKKGEITELQATIESNRQQILNAAQRLNIELERLKKLPQFQHEEILKDFDARSKALESLIQAQAMPGFPRNADDLHLVDKIVSGLPSIPTLPDENTNDQAQDASELRSTLVHLMLPRRK